MDFPKHIHTDLYYFFSENRLLQENWIKINRKRNVLSRKKKYLKYRPNDIPYAQERANITDTPVDAPTISKHNELYDTYLRKRKSEWETEMLKPHNQRMINLVKAHCNSGVQSFNPWFPCNRKRLDEYWSTFLPGMIGYDIEDIPVALPPKLELPYGRPVTVVVDAGCLIRGFSTVRSGGFIFLARISRICEVIIYSHPCGRASALDNDSGMISYLIGGDHSTKWLPRWWKSLRILNRDPDSTLIIDSTAEGPFMNPSNAVVFRPYDPRYLEDADRFDKLANFVKYAVNMHLFGKTPMYNIAPFFHQIDHDVVEAYERTVELLPIRDVQDTMIALNIKSGKLENKNFRESKQFRKIEELLHKRSAIPEGFPPLSEPGASDTEKIGSPSADKRFK